MRRALPELAYSRRRGWRRWQTMSCDSSHECVNCAISIRPPLGASFPMAVSVGCIAFFSAIAAIGWCVKERKNHRSYYGIVEPPDETAADQEILAVAYLPLPRPGHPTPAKDIKVYQRRRKPSSLTDGSIKNALSMTKESPAMTVRGFEVAVQIDGLKRGDELRKCYKEQVGRQGILDKPQHKIPVELAQVLQVLLETMTEKKYTVVADGKSPIVIGGENLTQGMPEARMQIIVEYAEFKTVMTAFEVTKIVPACLPAALPTIPEELPVEETPKSMSKTSRRIRKDPDVANTRQPTTMSAVEGTIITGITPKSSVPGIGRSNSNQRRLFSAAEKIRMSAKTRRTTEEPQTPRK